MRMDMHNASMHALNVLVIKVPVHEARVASPARGAAHGAAQRAAVARGYGGAKCCKDLHIYIYIYIYKYTHICIYIYI